MGAENFTLRDAVAASRPMVAVALPENWKTMPCYPAALPYNALGGGIDAAVVLSSIAVPSGRVGTIPENRRDLAGDVACTLVTCKLSRGHTVTCKNTSKRWKRHVIYGR